MLLGFRPALASILRQVLTKPLSFGCSQTSNGQGPRSVRHLSSMLSSPAYIVLCAPKRVYGIEMDYRSAIVRDDDRSLTMTNHDLIDETSAPGDARIEEIEESVIRKACLADKWKAEEKNTRGAIPLKRLQAWLQQPETTNECTQYTCLMNPTCGSIIDAWVRIEQPKW